MRSFLLALAVFAVASPAIASCPAIATGSDTPAQIAAQTAVLLCQQDELKAAGDAQFRQLQLEAQLRQQEILLEQQLKFQQQMAALNASIAP